MTQEVFPTISIKRRTCRDLVLLQIRERRALVTQLSKICLALEELSLFLSYFVFDLLTNALSTKGWRRVYIGSPFVPKTS